ncbi:uncharacterized protein BT62DRAFT_999936 [Guyanagaster necrorhizus]|uniref:Uncharacterized protein n=1 Tax=Guyanagaster necrorhizus TaxID=856835 RepID=A0A9P7W2K8_9AGAR|nr:uncharacterized protein BT62DRAFT_999936 [Guyanagaster necrorhizus MCA 3950]KAG7452176.1 hypothetical protein BT62DRAFT_999936 [Guyanagaster necrorhizus MCA 3950]
MWFRVSRAADTLASYSAFASTANHFPQSFCLSDHCDSTPGANVRNRSRPQIFAIEQYLSVDLCLPPLPPLPFPTSRIETKERLINVPDLLIHPSSPRLDELAQLLD